MRKGTIPIFGVRVKKRLIELNMTQRQLASEIGVNENYLTDILQGRRSGTKYRDAINQRLNLQVENKQEYQQREVI
jgi:transcriptional regulator with XRE-family HTH domain